MNKTRFISIFISIVLALTLVTYSNVNTHTEINELNDLEVVYIDVGQGDSALIRCGSNVMLIDAGSAGSDKTVADHLESRNISKISYLIATHPHEDHIGGMTEIVERFDIDKIIMPKVQTNTRTFENLLDAIASKDLRITTPVPGDMFSLGDATITILAPLRTYGDELNNSSVVLRIDHGDNSFLFMGDAEAVVENDLLSANSDVKANVLKVGHHGSKYSSGSEFISSVSPEFAVISVGENNKYGHPAEETLRVLDDNKSVVYRTDQSGTIIFTSDGKTLKVSTKNTSE